MMTLLVIAHSLLTIFRFGTYDTKLGYTGAVTFGSNWCYFSQIDKVIVKNDFEESATDWIDG